MLHLQTVKKYPFTIPYILGTKIGGLFENFTKNSQFTLSEVAAKNPSIIQYIFQEKVAVCPEKIKKFTPQVLLYGVNLWQHKFISDSGNTFDIVGIAWVYL